MLFFERGVFHCPVIHREVTSKPQRPAWLSFPILGLPSVLHNACLVWHTQPMRLFFNGWSFIIALLYCNLIYVITILRNWWHSCPIRIGLITAMINWHGNWFFFCFVYIFIRLCDWSGSQSLKGTEKAIVLEIFWSGSETSGLLTKPVNMLLEWTIYSHKEKSKSNDVSRVILQNKNMIYGKSKVSPPYLLVSQIWIHPMHIENIQKKFHIYWTYTDCLIINSTVWYNNHVHNI